MRPGHVVDRQQGDLGRDVVGAARLVVEVLFRVLPPLSRPHAVAHQEAEESEYDHPGPDHYPHDHLALDWRTLVALLPLAVEFFRVALVGRGEQEPVVADWFLDAFFRFFVGC